MTPLIEKTWEIINIASKYICEADKDIKADDTKKEIYATQFRSLYELVSKYMKETNTPLDRHKVAAIIMISTIKAEVLSTSNNEDIFIGNYVLAAEVGLSYMLSELNEALEDKELPAIDKFFFPEAISCETKYIHIFYRNLYFADNGQGWGLNPLDLAERLFLLEYLTLDKNGIAPNLLKTY